MRTRKERCVMRKLDPTKLPKIAIPIEKQNLKESYIKFAMKDLSTWEICWYQLRYTNPEYQQIKSRTQKWSRVWCYYENVNLNDPIIIVEWEVDYTTAYQNWRNVVGIQWVANLNKVVDQLTKLWVKTVIVLVDNDEAATLSIKKIVNRIPCYDWRYVLWNVKDINDAWVDGVLKEPQALASENLFVKYWAFKIKKSTRPLPDKSVDFLNIDTAMVLQNLYPQYTIKGDRIYDSWKLLDGYRYWKTKNAIVDFSGKERPQGNARSIAYSYYNDKKQTAEYLKRYT